VADLDSVLAAARPRESLVTLCVAGDLAGEYEAAKERLIDAQRGATSLDGSPEAREIAAQMVDLEARMEAATFTFRFRGLSHREWSDLLAQHPSPRPGEAFDSATFAPALVSAAAVDPAMTLAQAEQLLGSLSDAGADRLFDAAWRASRGDVSVPFSPAASAILSNTDGS
jgi:hypothetical protein